MFCKGNRWFAGATTLFGTGLLVGCTADTDSAGPDAVGQVAHALVPPAPVQVGPSGAGASTTPTYVWNSAAGATGYELFVTDTTGTKIAYLPVPAAAAGCGSGGQCSTTPSTALATGNATWWVRGTNADGKGPWSAPSGGMVFIVGGAGGPTQKPGLVTKISPTGTVTTATPPYTWDAITGAGAASHYRLWVAKSPSGATYLDQTFTAAQAGCAAGGVCSVTPTTALPQGAARFFVLASNALGEGPWGTAQTFTVSTVTPPPRPVLTAPTGTVTTTTPTYEWNASPGATQYQLWVNGFGAPNLIKLFLTPAQANCDADTTCSFAPTTALAEGAATFWVQAINSAGGTWSLARTFTVNLACDLSGTFAVREQTAVTWDAVVVLGTTVLDAGSATLSAWALRQHTISGNTLTVTQAPCGGTSPDICSTFLNAAFTQFTPDTIWQGVNMPVVTSTMTLNDPDPTEPFVGPTTAALLGLSLTTPLTPLGPWPPAWNSAGVNWHDHDSDTFLGITSQMRNTGTSPSCGNRPYSNLPDPSNPFNPPIDRIYVGSRAISNYSGTIMDCNTIEGDVIGPDNGNPQVNGHVRGCRHEDGTACSTATFQAIDQQGQTSNQHITNSTFTMIRVPASTTCAQVRAMTFP
jgi:hypothetical protein